jgi:hypothetical protein
MIVTFAPGVLSAALIKPVVIPVASRAEHLPIGAMVVVLVVIFVMNLQDSDLERPAASLTLGNFGTKYVSQVIRAGASRKRGRDPAARPGATFPDRSPSGWRLGERFPTDRTRFLCGWFFQWRRATLEGGCLHALVRAVRGVDFPPPDPELLAARYARSPHLRVLAMALIKTIHRAKLCSTAGPAGDFLAAVEARFAHG